MSGRPKPRGVGGGFKCRTGLRNKRRGGQGPYSLRARGCGAVYAKYQNGIRQGADNMNFASPRVGVVTREEQPLAAAA